MIVYQTDDNGVFVGETIAHPSPLEDGVWAIPRGCVTTAPPEFALGEFAIWDGEAWRVETIPVLDLEQEPERALEVETPPEPPTIEQIRDGAALSKIDFCRALYTAQILPADLVVDAARGKWPITFEAAIAGLPEAEQVDAKLAWAGATSVSRNAPLFLQLLDYFGSVQKMSKAKVVALGDQIFGIGKTET